MPFLALLQKVMLDKIAALTALALSRARAIHLHIPRHSQEHWSLRNFKATAISELLVEASL
jgi:hypothetical protein